jgi:molybdopterin converting factor subunit 1
MKLSVRLFARARDLAGTDSINLDLPAIATVANLRRQLGATCPALAGMLPHCAIAVNDEFAEDTMIVPTAAEVAVLPPVSGG